MGRDHDQLGRRNRLRPSSTGKRVSPTPRDLLCFSKLLEHGPLPSSFLLAFATGSYKSEKRAKERLTDLFHEHRTPHGGPYLKRPTQQFRTIDSRYQQLVYDLAPAASKALAEQKGCDANKQAQSGPWLHSLMVSCVTASIELACMTRDDLSYIPQSKILDRADAGLRWPIQLTAPKSGATYIKDLIPDAIFGLEYLTGNGSEFRFFALEADRATEPLSSTNIHRKSFERHLLQYAGYIEHGGYREHLNLTAPMLVLNLTTEQKRLDKMLQFTGEQFAGGCNYQLFAWWDAFSTPFCPPSPNMDLLLGFWKRAGDSNLVIAQG